MEPDTMMTIKVVGISLLGTLFLLSPMIKLLFRPSFDKWRKGHKFELVMCPKTNPRYYLAMRDYHEMSLNDRERVIQLAQLLMDKVGLTPKNHYEMDCLFKDIYKGRTYPGDYAIDAILYVSGNQQLTSGSKTV